MVGRAALAGVVALSLFAGGAAAQVAGILIVDRERALAESAPAQFIAAAERRERLALRARHDELQLELETEEAEIAALRDTSTKEVFEARVRAFDVKVREARRTSQRNIEIFQNTFDDARRALSDELEPILQDILSETGASLIVDARNVLAAVPGADVTDEVIRRLATATTTLDPAAAPQQ